MLQGGDKLGPAVDVIRQAGAVVDHVVTSVCWRRGTADAARNAGVRLLTVITPEQVTTELALHVGPAAGP